MSVRIPLFVLLLTASLQGQEAPLTDHHQHLFSPALVAVISPPPPAPPTPSVTAKDLVGLLDAAGIKRAVVLSTAYIFEQPSRNIEGAAEKIRAENDWTSQQLAPYKVDYHNPQHIEQVKRVFRAANGYRMPIVVHMRAAFNAKLPYGRDEALIFLNELVPAAPDVVIQIAHLAAAGAPSDPAADQAIEVFIEAIANGDARATRLYFDAPSVTPTATLTPEAAAAIASRVRRLGVQRVLFGSDASTGGALTPRAVWDTFRKLPLTDAEFRIIAGNVPPYLR